MSKVDVKVVFLGQHSVGKTTLVDRYLNGSYKPNVTATVGAAFAAKKVVIGGQTITLGIWDTAGQERYESMSRIYYRSARAACICFDLTSSQSYKKVKFWVEELLANEEQCIIYLVGTKVDLVNEGEARVVDAAEITNYAESVSGKYFETSSKTGQNVEALFTTIASDWLLSGEKTKQQPSHIPNPKSNCSC
eukprot:TRINITY_DN5139_c0_g3_i1.p1 TRINITY_DN5139_c0_g3~~TRINITY_DN5139_c0_g3_i1.p1  ORF type:complete len:192 (-),score=34.80 TRINITY_DN5139_c0_g3_i1:29-604(-)